MNFKDFWMDELRTAAILGVVMSLFSIFEKYVLLFGDMTVIGASMVVLIKSVVAICIFVWMIYYFTRRVANNWIDRVEVGGQTFEVKFSYSRALSYIMVSSMMAGIVVGVVNTIYVDIVGYDVYIANTIARLEEMRDMMAPYTVVAGTGPSIDVMVGQQIELIESQEKPSLFVNIISNMSSYMMYGGLVGLVVAAVARRKPNKQNDSEI